MNEGFKPTGTLRERMLNGEVEVLPGDDRTIITVGQRTTSFEVTLIDVNPALPWLLGRIVNPTLLHDACWDGEAIR